MSINSNSIATSDFDSMRIFILSADEVRAMSYGEVTKPETVNYRTLKPENGGLFCCKIFGPLRNDECLCGKYRGSRYRGTTCEKCGVEITSSRVRRMRMGHIELAAPVSHIWFLKSLPSRISLLLNIPLKNIERVLYFECHIVIDSGLSPFNVGDLLEEHELVNAYKEYGRDSFIAKIGSPAIQTMLANLNLVELCESLRNDLEITSSEIKRKKIIKRLRLIEDFIKSGNNPQDMIMNVLPVISPDLRPLMMLDGGRFVSSDQNDLYRYVINRNNRLHSLIGMNALEMVLSSEKRLLQEAVDALFDNGRRGKMLRSTNKRAYKSLTDSLKGKNGRFRQNLLGKRVDFSGRSVIVVGPSLKLHQCGLPKIMALEMFKPFIYSKLQLYGMVPTIKSAKRMVQNEDPAIWDVLEKVIHEHLVLLNRAPTLHRLGIQAFEPILIEGNAIQLHPLVCSAFNADFDGDQMAVHLPLSLEAQIESRVLMMSVNNILGPSNGKPIIIPSKDIVLGLYYLSLMDDEEESDNTDGNDEIYISTYLDLNEILYALEDKIISLHSPIRCRVPSKYKDDKSYSIEKTTAGRFILYDAIPENSNIKFSIINDVMNTKNITNLVDMVYRNCGQNTTVVFSDKLKEMGFKYATQSGISFGKDDMKIPDTKSYHVDAAYQEVKMFSSQYQDGLITKSESYNKVIETWSRCTDKVADDMMKGISLSNGTVKSLNSIYMMAESGARGSPAQIKQLAGMRGLMAKPSGEIIETPIIANFREGLNGFEYYYSTHGARKGLADTALKTANSGYLTRRLVDVAQDCVVCEYDCSTTKGLKVQEIISGGVVVAGIDEFTLGRVLAEDIFDLRNGELLLKRNTLISEKEVDILLEAGIDSAIIRSPLMCESLNGVCVSCYGRDLSTGYIVSIGEAAGVIAAQSVGEPGTQLTMRTFHVGGAASTGKIDISNINALISGTVVISSTQLVEKESEIMVLSRSCSINIVDSNGISKMQGNVPYGGKIYVKPGDYVEAGTVIADWDPHHVPILVEKSGKVVFHDLMYNVSLNEIVDDITGATNKVIMDWGRVDKKIGELRPRIELIDGSGESLIGRSGMLLSYMLPIGAIITVNNGQDVEAGDIVARIPRASVKTRDITGGLPRVVELFEARKPTDHAIISDIDGYIEISKAYYKSKRRVIVHSHDEDISSVEYLVMKGSHILVNDGDIVKKGDLLMEGDPDLHDILRILGVEALTLHMIMEIQQVYKLQGVKIDNKHIEVILRQMLSKVEIIDHGSSTFLVGECIERNVVNDFNKDALLSGKDQIKHRPILLGITRASLKTESFISAASFQETTRVLTEAAVAGKIDRFKGLKECVTAGRLLPVGTGFIMRKMKEGYIVHNNSLISVDDYFSTNEKEQ